MLSTKDLDRLIWKRESTILLHRLEQFRKRDKWFSLGKKCNHPQMRPPCGSLRFFHSQQCHSLPLVCTKRALERVWISKGTALLRAIMNVKKVRSLLIDLDHGCGVRIEGYYPTRHGRPEANAFLGGPYKSPVHSKALSACLDSKRRGRFDNLATWIRFTTWRSSFIYFTFFPRLFVLCPSFLFIVFRFFHSWRLTSFEFYIAWSAYNCSLPRDTHFS